MPTTHYILYKRVIDDLRTFVRDTSRAAWDSNDDSIRPFARVVLPDELDALKDIEVPVIVPHLVEGDYDEENDKGGGGIPQVLTLVLHLYFPLARQSQDRFDNSYEQNSAYMRAMDYVDALISYVDGHKFGAGWGAEYIGWQNASYPAEKGEHIQIAIVFEYSAEFTHGRNLTRRGEAPDGTHPEADDIAIYLQFPVPPARLRYIYGWFGSPEEWAESTPDEREDEREVLRYQAPLEGE